jgi:hypothetical protein
VAELARVCQTALPILELTSLVVPAGGRLVTPLHVANDGPPLSGVTVRVGLAGSEVEVELGDLPGWTAVAAGAVDLPVPPAAGPYDVSLRLAAAGRELATNSYPLRAVAVPAGAPEVTVVGEGMLDEATGELVRERLAAGETVVVLAQDLQAVGCYPVAVEMAEVATAWGSTVFHFTCDQRALPSLPERAVLAGEDATVVPTHLLTRVGEGTWPETCVVGAFKPVPDPLAGPVVGAVAVGPGRLVTCQYRLAEPARRGDPAARAILAELLHWAAGGAR